MENFVLLPMECLSMCLSIYVFTVRSPVNNMKGSPVLNNGMRQTGNGYDCEDRNSVDLKIKERTGCVHE